MKELIHKGKKYIFRQLKESDIDFINDRFKEDGKPVGLQNFQENICNFDDQQLLSMTLTIIMHYLLVSIDGKKPEYTAQEFIQEFGTGYQDVSLLYNQLNFSIGNTAKDVKKAGKQVNKFWKMKKKIRSLEYKLFQERYKNLRLSLRS